MELALFKAINQVLDYSLALLLDFTSFIIIYAVNNIHFDGSLWRSDIQKVHHSQYCKIKLFTFVPLLMNT